MDIENIQKLKIKCPCCPIETEDITRFKEHLVRCRKGIDKTVYLCKFYFGHLFQNKEDADAHEEVCIFKEGPVRYPEHKKKFILNKDNQYVIENENFPMNVEEKKAPLKIPERESIRLSNFESLDAAQTQIPQEKEPAFYSYKLHDMEHNTNTLLAYSTGLSFCVGDFYIQKFKPISEFSEFFDESKFGRELFDKYSTTFNYLLGPNPNLEKHFENDYIGYNDSKQIYNEILIIVHNTNSFLSKFFNTDFAILVVPASLLLDIPQSVTSANLQSFYRRMGDIELQIVNPSTELNYPEEENIDYGSKLCESLMIGNTEHSIKLIDEIESTPLTVAKLNELIKKIERITEMERKGKDKIREELDSEYEKLKTGTDSARYESTKKFEQFMSAKANRDQIKSSIDLKIKDLKSRFDKSLSDKLESVDMRYLLQKADLERQLISKQEKIDELRRDYLALQNQEEEREMRQTVREKKQELEQLKQKLNEKIKEREKIADDEKKIFEESNLTQGLKFEDFTCITCKTNRREIIYFPCRHFIACKACSQLSMQNKQKKDKAKCNLCNIEINECTEVKFVNYTI